jgi:tetratricopeptide (TPR) repeat protein
LSKRETLESWKEISAYLLRKPRTCQRWEIEFCLPVHRLDGSPRARVYAFKDELDSWLDKRLHETDAAELASDALGSSPAGLMGWQMLRRKARRTAGFGKPCVAIIYFVNKTGDGRLDYLSESLPAHLIHDLQRASDQVTFVSLGRILDVANQLGLVPTGSPSPADFQAVFARTRASHILQGDFSSVRDGLTVQCRLEDGRTRKTIPIGPVAGSLNEIVSLRDRLTEKILAVFNVHPPESTGPKAQGLPQAVRFCEMGRIAERKYFVGRSARDLAVAIKMFMKARNEDPGCVVAYLGLGDAYRWQRTFERTTKADLDSIAENYQKAYDINPDLPETNIGLGWNRYFQRDLVGAYHHFKRAMDIDPANLQINFDIGCFMMCAGQHLKAIQYFSKTILMAEVSSRVYRMRARCSELVGDYASALDDSDTIMELEPMDCALRCQRVRLLILMKRPSEAATDFGIAEALSPSSPAVRVTRVLWWAAQGKKDKALGALAADSGKLMIDTYTESRVYAVFGLQAQALAAIEGAIDTEFGEFPFCRYSYLYLDNPKDFFYDGLRDHPRFKRILEARKRSYEEQVALFSGL